jgi:hypothetical protein
MKISNKALLFAITFIVISVILRVIPHPPGVSPNISFAILASIIFNTAPIYAMIFSVLCMFIGDIASYYTYNQNYSTFSDFFFSFYNVAIYSFFFLLPFAIKKFTKKSFDINLLNAIVSGLAFWIVSNLMVFLSGQLYTLNTAGFLACYNAAIPFLKTQLIGDVIYTSIFVLSFQFISKYNSKEINSTL